LQKKAFKAANRRGKALTKDLARTAGENFMQEAIQQDIPEWLSKQPKSVQERLAASFKAGVAGSAVGPGARLAMGGSSKSGFKLDDKRVPVTGFENAVLKEEKARTREINRRVDRKISDEKRAAEIKATADGTPPTRETKQDWRDQTAERENIANGRPPRSPQPGDDTTRNEDTGRIRKENGLPVIPSREGETRADWQQQAIDEKVGENAEKLANDVIDGGKVLKAHEVIGFEVKINDMNHTLKQINAEIAGAGVETAAGLHAQAQDLTNSIDKLTNAAEITGSDVGKAMVARVRRQHHELGIEGVLNVVRAKLHRRNPDYKLTPGAEARLRKATTQVKEADAAVDAAEAKQRFQTLQSILGRKKKGKGTITAEEMVQLKKLTDDIRAMIKKGCVNG
jgi:hypothetical protein